MAELPFHCLSRRLTCSPTHMRRATAAVFALSTVLCAVDAARLPTKLPDPRVGASAVTASNSTEATGCEACCAGGSCSSAFRGSPGKCCGVIDDRSFCCPTAASSFGEGQCYQPDESTFRCRAAGTSRDGSDRPSPWYALFTLLIPVALLAACCIMCFRKPRMQQPMPVGQQYYGQGAPPPGAVYGYPATGQPYQSGGGYGASNLAGAGASPPTALPPPVPVSGARAPSAPPLAQATYHTTT